LIREGGRVVTGPGRRGRRWFRRATISARSPGGRRPGPVPPSFSAGSCCLPSP